MPVALLETEGLKQNTSKRTRTNKTNRKSINLFGHKYYIRPHALQIYEYIACTSLIILMYFVLYLCYLIAYK